MSPSSATKTSRRTITPTSPSFPAARKSASPGSRPDDRGHYISVSFEEPSLAAGFYTLVKTGAEKGYTLTYRKPMPKKRPEVSPSGGGRKAAPKTLRNQPLSEGNLP